MSKAEHIKELLAEMNPRAVLVDGMDDALIGICQQFGRPDVAAYNYGRCLKVLMKDMSADDAVEYFDYNIIGAYVGTGTPVFIISEDFEGEIPSTSADHEAQARYNAN